MEENKNKKIKKKVCPDCKGEGVIYTEYPWYVFAFNPVEKHICYKCKGEGSDYALFLQKKLKKLEKLKEKLKDYGFKNE